MPTNLMTISRSLPPSNQDHGPVNETGSRLSVSTRSGTDRDDFRVWSHSGLSSFDCYFLLEVMSTPLCVTVPPETCFLRHLMSGSCILPTGVFKRRSHYDTNRTTIC